MKIENAPKAETASDWWVGKKVTCGRCQRKITLEAGDPVRGYQNDKIRAAMLTCPCGQTLEVSEPLSK